MTSPPGTEFKRSKYRLLGLVGQGQFGRVFCAVHRQTGKLVALKNLERQRFPTHKFLRELRILLSLQHPNIVTCQALEHTATGRYLVMDYCEGGTLRSLIAEETRLSLPQSLKLVADILAGLDHAHSRGIVHCDIKPENILLNVEPNGWIARVSDFGIARLNQEVANQDFGNTGSPAYMAPERFYGQYSLTSDLYSVGILLFELLTGYRPFAGTPADLMSAHLNRPVKIPDTVPDIWHPIIITALQKLSARRFRSAGEMLSALRSAAVVEGSGSWLDPQAIQLPLLIPTSSPPGSPLHAQREEVLRHPITALAVVQPVSQALQSSSMTSSPQSSVLALSSPTYLYRAGTKQVAFQIYEAGILADDHSHLSQNSHPSQREVWHPAPYKSTIQALIPRVQGCFVVTQRSLHLLPLGIEANPNLICQTVLESNVDYLAALDPRGRWMAALTIDAEAETGTLVFRTLPCLELPVTLAPHPVYVALKGCVLQSLQFLALDERHVVVMTQTPAKPHVSGKQSSLGTLIKVLTRRGNLVGTLSLPLQVGRVVPTLTPYQLLATDRQNPKSLLLIDLKPYRILRLGTQIEPEFVSVTVWGYILANSQGQILFLDREGRQIGYMLAPHRITAITSIGSYGLLVATWDGQQGCLHTIDLRQTDVELLF